MDHSFFNICDKFLRLNKICLDRASIKEQLYTQDSYPSLNAFTDVLSAFGIEHRALRIGWDQLMEYGTPAMLHYQGRMPRFVIATRVTESEITYYTSGLRKKTEPRGDFLKHWDGTSLYVIEPESFPWKCYLANGFKGHRLQLLFATTVLFLLSLWGILPVEKDLFLYTSSILKIIGLLVSIFLLRHDWGKSSRSEQHFCTLAKTFSCDAVLGSKASKLFGVIKMSDIGIVYFTGGLAYLLFSSFGITDSQTTLDMINALSFCTFPYILFSLSYQRLKVKKWCPLCLGVLTVLMMEIVSGGIRLMADGFRLPSLYHCVITGLFFLMLALAWDLLNSFIKAYLNIGLKEIRYLKLKRDASVFRSMLDRQPALEMDFSDRDILIGDRENRVKVTIAINPFCVPCLHLYSDLLELLKGNPGSFCLNIRFMSMDEEARNEPVGLTLVSLYYRDKDLFLDAFDFWRKGKDYGAFQKRFGAALHKEEARQELQKHFAWRKNIRLGHTPAVFIGNRKLPDIYTHEDLFYFLRYGKL